MQAKQEFRAVTSNSRCYALGYAHQLALTKRRPVLIRRELLASADGVSHDTFCRAGLLLGRLHAEASDDAAHLAAVFGATFGGGRLEAMWNAEDNAVARSLRKTAAELDAADARAYACAEAYLAPMSARGALAPVRAASFADSREWLTLWLGTDPITSKKKMPEDAHP